MIVKGIKPSFCAARRHAGARVLAGARSRTRVQGKSSFKLTLGFRMDVEPLSPQSGGLMMKKA